MNIAIGSMVYNIEVLSDTILKFDGKYYRSSIGENSVSSTKQEGDKTTPIGSFLLRTCWYRADRMEKPVTGLPLRIIQPQDGWCDDPDSPGYNRPVTLPFAASREQLWREDSIYDIIVPMGYNDEGIAAGKGSAIFFHLATPDYTPTLGCVAVAREDMLEILRHLDSESRIIITSPKLL